VDSNPTSAAGAAGTDSADTLRQERDEAQDRLLRTAAEYDNYRKRTERERRELSDAVAADLIRDVLPALDDLERALSASQNSADPVLRSGVELIYKQLLDALRRRGAEPFESVGHDFDPSWHEAVASEPAKGHRDGEIVAELRRGFRIGSRLLRPAQVRVAKA
jgi:molecular chaperone GrpE